jgi:hypothetical protein
MNNGCCKSDIRRTRYVELHCPHEECGREYFVLVNNYINPHTILSWIEACDRDHKCLSDIIQMKRNLKTAPSRILIGLQFDCLVQITEDVRYTCLSYVWGHTGEYLTTTRIWFNYSNPVPLFDTLSTFCVRFVKL